MKNITLLNTVKRVNKSISTPFTFKLSDLAEKIRVQGLEKWLVSLRNGSEKWLVSLRNGFEKWLVSFRNTICTVLGLFTETD